MLPIFNRYGDFVGWLDQDCVRNGRGRVVAFVTASREVYGLRGRHLGGIDAGYIWDHSGAAVAWMRGATGLPLTPPAKPTPPAPARELSLVFPSDSEVAPEPAIPTCQWSEMNWAEFLNCENS
jgi:hypothetical protein